MLNNFQISFQVSSVSHYFIELKKSKSKVIYYVVNNNFSYTQRSFLFFLQKDSYYIHDDTDAFFLFFLQKDFDICLLPFFGFFLSFMCFFLKLFYVFLIIFIYHFYIQKQRFLLVFICNKTKIIKYILLVLYTEKINFKNRILF